MGIFMRNKPVDPRGILIRVTDKFEVYQALNAGSTRYDVYRNEEVVGSYASKDAAFKHTSISALDKTEGNA